ncbi:MAG: hypothetical protein LBT47_01870 [Deltaproteobacteria bacterium]|jgi:4-amino-4-deoxychorismate lyase|nr:hypothetical protein [Deltaproteobacteria bacterium]
MLQPLFLESIKAQNGQYHLLEFHQKRVDQVLKTFFPRRLGLDLQKILPAPLPEGLFKVRLVYGEKLFEVESAPYQIVRFQKAALVQADQLDYAFKYLNRQPISNLRSLFKGGEIIIVKNGLLTDSSIANLVLENEQGLFTPQTPLLAGVKREYLLAKKIITAIPIKPAELTKFYKIRFINAMLDLEDDVFIDTEQVSRVFFDH